MKVTVNTGKYQVFRVNFVDYKEYIKPMIADLKDGDTQPLTKEDIDGLMRVIRCKVEHLEGLITDDEYSEKLADAYK
jgi:hypothetical protein